MANSIRRSSTRRKSAQKRAAELAEEAAKALRSFADSLKLLETAASNGGKQTPTPRNWWRVQAARFENDPTFGEFVARVQAARRQEW
jgi:hypothetical protein